MWDPVLELKSNKLKLFKIHAENHGTNCYWSNSPSLKDSTVRFDVLLKDALRIQQCVVKLVEISQRKYNAPGTLAFFLGSACKLCGLWKFHSIPVLCLLYTNSVTSPSRSVSHLEMVLIQHLVLTFRELPTPSGHTLCAVNIFISIALNQPFLPSTKVT